MRNLFVPLMTFLFCIIFSKPILANTTENTLSSSICEICHLCPAPFGICIFYFIIPVFIILFIALILSGRSKKCPLCKEKCKKNSDICPKCGYDFTSGLQSTLSIRVSDNQQLSDMQNNVKNLTSDNHSSTDIDMKSKVTQTDNLTSLMKKSNHSNEDIEDIIENTTSKSQKNSQSMFENTIEIIGNTKETFINAQRDTTKVNDKEEIENEAIDFNANKNTTSDSKKLVKHNLKSCPNCNAKISAEARFCGKCGTKLF